MVYPNPAISSAKLRLNSENEWIRVEILDLNGAIVQVVFEGNLSRGEHTIPMEIHDLSFGQYIVKVHKQSGLNTIKLIKAR